MSNVGGKSIGRLIVVISDLSNCRTKPLSKASIGWYDRETGKRLHIRKNLRHVCAEVIRDLCDFSEAYVFVSTSMDAIDLQQRIKTMCEPIGMTVESVSASPLSVPTQVLVSLQRPQVRAYAVQSAVHSDRLDIDLQGINQFDFRDFQLSSVEG